MRVLVVGGSGFIGSAIATLLRAGGHEVVAASRRVCWRVCAVNLFSAIGVDRQT